MPLHLFLYTTLYTHIGCHFDYTDPYKSTITNPTEDSAQTITDTTTNEDSSSDSANDTDETNTEPASPSNEPASPSSEPASPSSEPSSPSSEPSSPSSEPSNEVILPNTCYTPNLVGTDLLSGQSSFGTSESTQVNGYTDQYLYDASNYIKIGVREDWGGSIIFFGLANGTIGMNNSNTIDANDTGREVQVAFYDPDRVRQGCAHNASCQTTPLVCPNSITYLGWNPVQGGNRCNNGSPIASISNQQGRLNLSVQPLHWNPNWSFTDCTNTGCSNPSLSMNLSDVLVEQRLRFVDTHIVELHYVIHEQGGIDHAPTLQELPTVYSANGNNGPDLWKLLDANGNQVAIDIPANDGFFYKSFTSSLPWVSLQNNALSYGIGILYENGISDFQGWQNRSLPFNNVRASLSFGIPANSTIQARAYLMLGSYATIEGLANSLYASLPPFGTLDIPAHQQTWNGTTLDIQGWALDNQGIQSIIARIDDQFDHSLQYGSSRPDVCVAWPGYPNCSSVGFYGTVDISTLPTLPQCAHQIEILATDTHGNTRVISRTMFYLP